MECVGCLQIINGFTNVAHSFHAQLPFCHAQWTGKQPLLNAQSPVSASITHKTSYTYYAFLHTLGIGC